MVKSGYFNGALEADIKFHETLMEISGNEKLMRQTWMITNKPTRDLPSF